MSEITYEKFSTLYYVFSHKPKVRVYLGELSPEDYIHDELEQRKRSASTYYYEIATGKKVSQKKAFSSNTMIWFGEEFTHELDKKENHKYGCKCEYDFTRRLPGMSSWGNLSTGLGVEYPSNDKAMERLARCYYMNQTLEEYDAQQEVYRLKREETKRKYPLIHNLMMVNGETYHVNDAGDRITFDEHVALMKAGGYITEDIKPSPLAKAINECTDCDKADVWCDKHTKAVIESFK